MADVLKCYRSRQARSRRHGCGSLGRKRSETVGLGVFKGLAIIILQVVGVTTGCGDRGGPIEPPVVEPTDTISILKPGGIVTGVDGVVLGATEGALAKQVEVQIERSGDPTTEIPFPEYLEEAIIRSSFYRVMSTEEIDRSSGGQIVIGFPVPESVAIENLAIALLHRSSRPLRSDVEFDVSLLWQTVRGTYNEETNLYGTLVPHFGVEPSTLVLLDGLEWISSVDSPTSTRFVVECVDNRWRRRCREEYVQQTRDALDQMYNLFVHSFHFPEPRLRHPTTVLVEESPSSEEDVDRYMYYLKPRRQGGGVYRPEPGEEDGGEGITYFWSAPPFDRTTRHELFHAFQFGHAETMKNWPNRLLPWGVIEGTARAAETVESWDTLTRSAESRESWAPREIDYPLLMNQLGYSLCPTEGNYWGACAEDYASQDFWVYLGRQMNPEDPQPRYLKGLFERGGLVKDLDDWLREEGPFTPPGTTWPGQALGAAYWSWAKNQAFEKRLRVGLDHVGELIPRGPRCAWSGHGSLQEILYSPGASTEMDLDSLPPLTSMAGEVRLEPGDEPYQATAKVTSTGAGIEFKFYGLDEVGTRSCWDVEGRDSEPHRFFVYDEPVRAYALVSNTHVSATSGQITLELKVAHLEALSGRVIHQFTSTPIPGVTVTSTEGSVSTDASGRFTVAVASPDDELVFSGSNIHTRRTFGQGSDLDWRVIPADFDMDLFDEVARRLGDLIDVAQNDRTHKWTGGSPEVFIDTRNYGYAPGVLPQEVGSHVAAYIDRWSAGTVSPAQVTVTNSPPADGTVGTIVIRFVDLSDLKTEEGGETIWALGLTHPWAYWDRYEIVSGAIELDLVSSGLDMDPGLVVGRELGHIFGMGQFHRNRPMMMREVTPPPGTPFSAFEAAVAHIVYSRLPGTRTPDTEEKAAAAPAPPAPSQLVGRPILNRVRVR